MFKSETGTFGSGFGTAHSYLHAILIPGIMILAVTFDRLVLYDKVRINVSHLLKLIIRLLS